MKVTFIGHASILVESRGVCILSDPWWAGPCFGAQWWLYPEAYLEALRGKKLSYIYISHGHNDHFHPGTLAKLDPKTKILVSKHIDIAEPLRELGFQVIEIASDEEFDAGSGVKCRVMPTHGDDTLMTITDGEEVCVNLNDALHAAPAAVQTEFSLLLKKLHPRINYLFCGYGTASHFPNCYFIPGKDNARTAIQRQHYFNASWAHLVHALQPQFAFPFAADVVLLEKELFPLNEPVHNGERPTKLFESLFPGSPTRVMDIAPGFAIENGKVVCQKLRQPVSNELLEKIYRDKIQKANSYPAVSSEDVRQLTDLLADNVRLCMPYLRTFDGNYLCLIAFRNSTEGIELRKKGDDISVSLVSVASRPREDYDVIYTTRLAYLKRSLTSKYGHEILFVGSGGFFTFSDAAKIRSRIHEELRTIIKKQSTCPPPRYGRSSKHVFQTKQIIKKALGIKADDLYDLERWTVFSS